MLENQVNSVIQSIMALQKPGTKLDAKLAQALASLKEYGREQSDLIRKQRLDKFHDYLASLKTDNPSFTYACEDPIESARHPHERPTEVITYIFNGTYGFRLYSHCPVSDLEQYLDQIYPLLFNNKQPPVENNSPTQEVESKSDTILPLTLANFNQETVEGDEESTEAQKQKSIEHLNKVREGMNASAEAKRNEQLKLRTDEIAHYIANNFNTTQLIKSTATAIISEITTPAVKLSDLLKQIKEALPIEVTDDSLLRTVIRTVEINLKHKLALKTAVSVDVETSFRYLTTLQKMGLAYTTICNLTYVAAHEAIRPYSVFALITYMLDYCDRTSSLNIAETPEEIVDLMAGVYDIFVSNALKTDFVYDAATDLQKQILPDQWHLNHEIVKSYLDQLPKRSLNDASESVNKLVGIYRNRDTLMSYQNIKPDNVIELKSLLTEIIGYQDAQTYSAKFEDDTYLIITRDVGTFAVICIYIDNMGCLSYIQQVDGKASQQYYLPNDASMLLKWFEITIPKARSINTNPGEK